MSRTRWLAALLVCNVALAAPSVNSVATSEATALQLGGTGTAVTRIVKVADLNVTSIGLLGFSLTVSSTGVLGTSDGLTPIAFQLTTVSAAASAPSAADFTTPSGGTYVYTSLIAGILGGTVTRQLYILYSGAALQDPGAYLASVSVTASDN